MVRMGRANCVDLISDFTEQRRGKSMRKYSVRACSGLLAQFISQLTYNAQALTLKSKRGGYRLRLGFP